MNESIVVLHDEICFNIMQLNHAAYFYPQNMFAKKAQSWDARTAYKKGDVQF